MSTLGETCVQDALNDYLADYPFLDGYTPSQADVTVFKALAKISNDLRHRPHLRRWHKHINSYSRTEKSVFRTDNGELFTRYTCKTKTSGSGDCGFQVGKFNGIALGYCISSIQSLCYFRSVASSRFLVLSTNICLYLVCEYLFLNCAYLPENDIEITKTGISLKN